MVRAADGARARQSKLWINYSNLSLSLDAVPKKRGPKTDVLEALLKRVDGLEAKLKEKNAEDPEGTASELQAAILEQVEAADNAEPAAKRQASEGKSSPTASPSTIASKQSAPMYVVKSTWTMLAILQAH